jgi:hypothetical protein
MEISVMKQHIRILLGSERITFSDKSHYVSKGFLAPVHGIIPVQGLHQSHCTLTVCPGQLHSINLSLSLKIILRGKLSREMNRKHLVPVEGRKRWGKGVES